MKRREFIRAIGVGSVLLTMGAASEKKKPNLLLIVSEDNGPELSCYGEPYVKTPVLDRMADQGVRFEHAYVPYSVCSPSRAAYLTGLYPHQNGQIGLATHKFAMYRKGTPSIPTHLKKRWTPKDKALKVQRQLGLKTRR